jgi:hypothetical protein
MSDTHHPPPPPTTTTSPPGAPPPPAVIQVLMRTVSIHEQLPGGGDQLGPCLLEEVVPYRQFTAQEVDLLATLSGLEVRRWGGAFGGRSRR